MSDHLNRGIGIFLEAVRNLEQIRPQIRPDVETVDREQDVLRHGQNQAIPGIGDLNVAVELLAQFGLLLIERVADGRTTQGADRAAEQGALTLAVTHGGPGGGPDKPADQSALLRLLARIITTD